MQKKTATIMSYIGAAFVVGLAVITCMDVFGRYLLNSPLQGTYELSGNFLAVISACGIAAATALDEHISVDSLYERLSKSKKLVLARICSSISIIVFAVLCWQGFTSVRDSLNIHETTQGIVSFLVSPFRIMLLIGFILSLVVLILSLKNPNSSESDIKPEN